MLPIIEATKKLYKLAHHAAKMELVTPAEVELEKQMQQAFKKQGKAFVTAFKAMRGRFAEALSEGELEPVFRQSELESEQAFAKPLENAVKVMLMAGAQGLIGEMELGISFTLRNPAAEAYIRAHGAALIAGINETTRSEVRTLLAQAMEEGWSYGKTAKELIRRYEEFAEGRPQGHIASRAHGIAITEAGNAYEAGNYQAVQEMVAMGVKMEKSWDTSGGGDTCEDCVTNAAEGWIDFGQVHSSGDDHPLAHPYCKCDEFYQIKEG
jgi:hypothetical protein